MVVHSALEAVRIVDVFRCARPTIWISEPTIASARAIVGNDAITVTIDGRCQGARAVRVINVRVCALVAMASSVFILALAIQARDSIALCVVSMTVAMAEARDARRAIRIVYPSARALVAMLTLETLIAIAVAIY